jgi:hypothetical protein
MADSADDETNLPFLEDSRRPPDPSELGRLYRGVQAGFSKEEDYRMRLDPLKGPKMESRNASGNLMAFPLTASLLRRRAFSFDHVGSAGFWDTYPGILPFYTDRAHDVPDGAGRFYPESPFTLTAQNAGVLYPQCWVDATLTGLKYGNDNPCLNRRLGPGGVGKKSQQLD